MANLRKREPRTIKAHLATVTLRGDHVEIRRSGLARIAAERHTVIPLADIVQVQWKDPTMLVNGCVFMATAEDVKTVKALGTTKETAIGGNSHTVLFTGYQHRRYAELLAVLKALLPDVPTAPAG